jgi:dienelactone hydrolase
MKNLIRLTLVGVFFVTQSYAKVEISTVEYKDGETVLLGRMAHDTKFTGKRPAILIVHDWMGMGPNVEARLKKVAEMGYVAFAADIYGKDVRPKNQTEAAAAATVYKQDQALMRKRVTLAYEEMSKQKNIDMNKFVAIGYCFGGQVILELARSGAKAKGFVSFHGALSTQTPGDAKNIKGEVLAFHGADDPFVPLKEVEAFEHEMRDGKVNWQLVKYGNTVHSFTIPTAGSDPSTGQAYNADSDQKSWEAFRAFLHRVI